MRNPLPSVSEPRVYLLNLVLQFVREAALCPGVMRIALVGSLATLKPIPKDADVLVTMEVETDLAQLARAGRRLKGQAGSANLGADIFLCDPAGRYFGRVCGYRECHLRASCYAIHCGRRQHLNDDLGEVDLSLDVTLSPPFLLWPRVERRKPAPEEVERVLLTPLEQG